MSSMIARAFDRLDRIIELLEAIAGALDRAGVRRACTCTPPAHHAEGRTTSDGEW